MIRNLFDVPEAIFYRKCYKDKQNSLRGCGKREGRTEILKSNIYPCRFQSFVAENYHDRKIYGKYVFNIFRFEWFREH